MFSFSVHDFGEMKDSMSAANKVSAFGDFT
jgi:hypothetical protein